MLSFLFRLPAHWPHVVLLVIAAAWGILAVLTAPLFEVVYVTSGRGVMILCGYILAFVLGSWAVSAAAPAGGAAARARNAARGRPDLRFALVCTSVLAMTGIALRLYDRLILRSADVTLSDIARRKLDIAVTASDSPLGVIAAPLTGFCFLPAMLILLNPKLVGPRVKIVAFMIALFPPVETVVFQGGTSGVALALFLLLSVMATRPLAPAGSSRKKRRHLTPGQQFGLLAFGIGGLSLGGALFTARVHAMTGSISQYLLYAAGPSGNIVIPSQTALSLVDIPVLGQIGFVIYWISLYLTSGVYNLMFVLERGFIFHTDGAIQAQVFLRAFDILTGNPSTVSASDANPLIGLYQTMFGDVYLDFGVVGGLVQCLLMGVIAAMVHRARLNGNFAAQLIDPILKTFLLMGIFVSSFSSTGLFVLLAAMVLLVLIVFAPKAGRVGRAPAANRRPAYRPAPRVP